METLRQFQTSMSNFVQGKQLGFATWVLLLLSGMLLFVYSLPHAIALRKLFAFVAFLLAFKYFWEVLQKKPKPLLTTVQVFVLLQVWMLVISGFISNNPLASFSEWKGQWLPAIMSFAVGIGLAHALTLSKLKDLRVAVALVITIPIGIFLCVNVISIIYDLILAGKFLPDQYGIGGQKGIISYQITLLMPILIAELLSRLVKGNRLLPVPVWVIAAIFILAVFTLILASSRNGVIIMLLAFVTGAVMIISEIRKASSVRKTITYALATMIFVFSIGLVSYKTDSRWQNFLEAIPVAWDIDRNLSWLDGTGKNLPLTASGKQVNASEYYRIAWAHEGVRMLIEHPWGEEISRNIFQKLVLEKYGQAGMAHSHNGWIDFGLEVGIPGLLLWSWILWQQAIFGWRAWSIHKEPLGVALAVMVIMFAVHGFVDSIFREHELEQFMLVAGLLFSALSFQNTSIEQIRMSNGGQLGQGEKELHK